VINPRFAVLSISLSIDSCKDFLMAAIRSLTMTAGLLQAQTRPQLPQGYKNKKLVQV
jgi:hypothetical protein